MAGATLLAVGALLQKRTYTVELLLTTVESSSASKLPSAAAGLLNLSRGFEATPALVSRLLRMSSVLEEVADAPMTVGGRSQRVVDAAFPGKTIEPARRAEEMERLIRTSVDKESGIMSLDVTHKDSALARRTSQLLIASVRKAFARISRAQATELRVAQEQRVAIAGEKLHDAEAAVARFATANRVVADYSALQVERKSLDRSAQIAQSVYMQAVADRESAVGKELETAPALVVVDDIPPVVAPDSRRGVIKVAFGALVGVILFVFYAYWRDRRR